MSYLHASKKIKSLRSLPPVDQTSTTCFTDVSFRPQKLGFNHQHIARDHRFAEFNIVCTQEVADTAGVRKLFPKQNASYLSHRLDLQNSWHDGMIREMTLKKGLVDRDLLCSDTFVDSVKRKDPVYHQKRITMWKNLHDI